MKHYDQLSANFINGEWVESAGTESIAVINPATGEEFGHFIESTPEEVAQSLAAARAAQPAWGAAPLEDRITVIENFATLVEANMEELARMRTSALGAPFASSLTLSNSLDLLRMYVESVRKVEFRQVRSDSFGTAIVERRPVGVVAGIVPWNVPVRNEIKKLIPALITGNAVVLKASPQSPFVGAALVDLLTEAGVPAGVVGLVSGGAKVGEAMVTDPNTDKIAFTGSTAAGRRIAELAGPLLKRVQLELGGKSAAIVLPDADLQTVVDSMMIFGYANSGQICASLSRLILPEERHDEIVEALKERIAAFRPGDPYDSNANLGPVISSHHRDWVDQLVKDTVAAGATAETGGAPALDAGPGWFYQPTLLTGVRPGMRSFDEEIFGPVLSVIRYAGEDEAVEIANNSEYGLHGAVFGADAAEAYRVGRRIHTGTLAVNSFDVPLSAPFGGVKCSGLGRENGVEGFDEYLEYHTYKFPNEETARAVVHI
ncbi:aldehyde dehydrogenase family protein [Ammonicoccus fulvus]|uniref:Aldehyde dehydrogenase family protein n=1 Tax=Ammonicoccus fulvus TaxID=3138240 RepID=A0ABZ3FJ89_9ACTN